MLNLGISMGLDTWALGILTGSKSNDHDYTEQDMREILALVEFLGDNAVSYRVKGYR